MEFELKVFSEAQGVRHVHWEAPSREAACAAAQAQGLAVLSSRSLAGKAGPGEDSRDAAGLFGGSRNFPLTLFSRELLALQNAGLPLLESIETLGEKEQSPAVRRIIDGISARLKSGKALSLALGDFPQAFPPLYVASIRASEHSGAIPDALRRFIAYQEQVDTVRKKVTSAMIYPTLLLAAGGLVVVFLMGYVVPRFSRIYSDRITDMPWLSRLLLEWGRLLDDNGWVAMLVLALALAAAWHAASRSELRTLLVALLQRIPAVGSQLHLYQLTRLYRTLGMLLRGGLSISAALELVPGLLTADLRQRLEAAATQIREGQPLSLALTQQGLATTVAARLLHVGERTGQMHEMLDNIASFHEDEIARRVDMFTRTFEPALMMAIGLAIGAIVILMYMPIFELAGSFSG